VVPDATATEVAPTEASPTETLPAEGSPTEAPTLTEVSATETLTATTPEAEAGTSTPAASPAMTTPGVALTPTASKVLGGIPSPSPTVRAQAESPTACWCVPLLLCGTIGLLVIGLAVLLARRQREEEQPSLHEGD
jgi:hypothetical protein